MRFYCSLFSFFFALVFPLFFFSVLAFSSFAIRQIFGSFSFLRMISFV